MKYLFIPARYIEEVKLSPSIIEKLPKKIGLITTAQFLNSLENVKTQLEKSNRRVFIGKGFQDNNAQILGCDVSSAVIIEKEIDAFLYIGTGEFHPRGVALKTKKDIFIFNPVSKIFSKLNKSDIEQYKKKKRGAYLKFLSSKNLGILVCTKHGQNNLKKALELKKKLKNKNCYIFITENICLRELENFPFIECLVNTACPRIDEDINCVNLANVYC